MDELHQIDNSNLGILWQRIRTFVMTLLTCKANRSTTLSGYGITDAYTKSDVDNIVEQIELTPGPQGEQGEKGEKGDTGNTGATGIGVGLKGEIDVTFEIGQELGTNVHYVQNITHIDDVLATGLYILHSGETADSIMSVERLSENMVVQCILVGGFRGMSTHKFIHRAYQNGEWSNWTKYNILEDKQDSLSNGEEFTIMIGNVFLLMNQAKLTKLKNFLEE